MDFVILSVNGRDVSNSSHEEAVRYFESAQEPITIQVLRKPVAHSAHGEIKSESLEPKKSTCSVTTSVQTDLAGLLNEEYVENYYVFEDGEEYDEDNDQDDVEEAEEYDEMNQIPDCKLREDVYFEEVTLRKSSSTEKLGLTVCYNYSCERDNSEAAEVYISEISRDSLAARDGRLREGDQILQVNGKDIESKEQTERVFAHTKNTVVILVSRCLYQPSSPISPDNVPAYQNSMIELLLQHQKRQYEGLESSENLDQNERASRLSPPPPPVPLHNQSTTGVNSLSSTSSSQNSHTSNKDCNPSPQFLSEKNPNFGENLKDSMKKMDELSIGSKLRSTIGGRVLHADSDTEHIYETIPESDNEPIYSSPYESKLNFRRNEIIAHDHRSKSSKSSSSVEEKDTSSAYNTGESCHSNPLVLELQKVTDPRELRESTLVLCPSDNTPSTTPTGSRRPPTCEVAANQVLRSIQASLSAPQFNNYQSTLEKDEKKASSTYHYHCHHRQQNQPQYQYYYQPQYQPNLANNRNSHVWDNRDKESIGSGVMYTNVDNLEQTMMLQQQIFTQALNRKNITTRETRVRNPKSRGKFRAPNLTQYHFIGSQQVRPSNTMTLPEDKCDPRMEWKVKRRPDGTRYIVRRPVRSRLLGNRTLEISEERAGQTTEDDTVSEIKLGRYWTKDERKRHLEQARQRKQRHQAVLRQQLKQHESINCDHGEEEPKEISRKSGIQDGNVIQNNKIDDNHCGGHGKPSMGLLSVTTV